MSNQTRRRDHLRNRLADIGLNPVYPGRTDKSRHAAQVVRPFKRQEQRHAAPTPTEDLLDTHLDGLRLHVRRRLSNEDDAQDIAQEACLRLLKAGTSRRIDNPKAYLYSIANNLLYQHYNGRTQPLETGMDLDDLAAQQPPVDEAVAVATHQELIEQAMRALPHKCQTALILRWHHGLHVAEIADQMSLSRAMIKKYLANGLAHFRKRLVRYAD